MKLYAILNEERIITAVLMREEEPTEGLWVPAPDDSSWATGGHVAEDGTYTAPPAPPAPPPEPIVIPAAIFMARLTDEEADAIDRAMSARTNAEAAEVRSGLKAQPLRVRSSWAAVVNRGDPIREDPALSPLWAPLRQTITVLFDEEKADELMERPVAVFSMNVLLQGPD